MAETPEGKVKRWVKQCIKDDLPGAYVYWPPGGMFGRAGTPDCFLVWRGVFGAIEVKAEGGKPTALQLRELRRIDAQGGIAALLTGRDRDRWDAIVQRFVERAGGRDES